MPFSEENVQKMTSEMKRKGNRDETAARFFRDPKRPGHGWCDEWAGVGLSEDCVCEPYIGRPKDNKTNGKDGGK